MLISRANVQSLLYLKDSMDRSFQLKIFISQIVDTHYWRVPQRLHDIIHFLRMKPVRVPRYSSIFCPASYKLFPFPNRNYNSMEIQIRITLTNINQSKLLLLTQGVGARLVNNVWMINSHVCLKAFTVNVKGKMLLLWQSKFWHCNSNNKNVSNATDPGITINCSKIIFCVNLRKSG